MGKQFAELSSKHIEFIEKQKIYFTFESNRDDLAKWSDKHGAEGSEKYWVKRNQKSIDGFDTEIVQRAGIKQNSSDS
ncbi:hypothetical protein [Shewanella woodyi]|uniref:hypothetical protein n=1 Tax=Shewanella woodyi TaxID=60961 RepID=UPI0037491381